MDAPKQRTLLNYFLKSKPAECNAHEVEVAECQPVETCTSSPSGSPNNTAKTSECNAHEVEVAERQHVETCTSSPSRSLNNTAKISECNAHGEVAKRQPIETYTPSPSDPLDNTTSGCLWSAEDVNQFVKSTWTSKCHNYFVCGTNCDKVSTGETGRLKKIEEDKRKKGIRRPDKLKHAWLLKKKYWSVCYVEGEGFYCMVCKKYSSKNCQNKSQIFVQHPSVRLKDEALKSHIESEAHVSALEADLLQQKSCFHQILVEKKAVEKSVLQNAFSTTYFLMKEHIANRKFIPLLNFMEKAIGIQHLQHFEHRSEGSIQEIFKCVGSTVKESLLRKVRSANAYCIMIDEVTDISVTSQLVTFITFYDRDSQTMAAEFLASQNVLETFESCNSQAITELVRAQLFECYLDISKLMGLSTDGASVMIGKNNGVAAQLRQSNAKLINIHCVCHRLALACTDSCNELKPIKQAEDVLRQLYYYFQNSPKRMACFLKTQLALKEAETPFAEKTIKFLSRRLQKAWQTRWLSFDSSVMAALRDYEAIVLTLQHLDDARAVGLLIKMKSVKFIGVLFILRCILPILAMLSKQFQADCFHFSMVKPAVFRAISALDEVENSQKPLADLHSTIDSFTNISTDLRLRKDDTTQLEGLLSRYVGNLKENIRDRLGPVPDVVEAYGVFDPLSMPTVDSRLFHEYGVDEMKVLGEDFWPGNAERQCKLLHQWGQANFYVSNKKELLQKQTGQSSTIFMCHIVKNGGIFNPLLFEELLFVAEVGLALPCSNAWPERGGSVIKLTKTKCRNRLGNSMLNSLMQVSINGPETASEQACALVDEAVESWLSEKKRKKLKRKRVSTVLASSSSSLEARREIVLEESEKAAECDTHESENTLSNAESKSTHDNVDIQAMASAVGLDDVDCDCI